MPGFFSSPLANKLTAFSGHFIDWSRVGSLISASSHRYSWYELIQRGFIVTSMGLGTYLGYQQADEEEIGLNAGLYSMAGCFIAFVASHCIVIAPLIYKRMQMQKKCQESEQEILMLLTELPHEQQIASVIEKITAVIGEVMSLNLSDKAHAKASQTWGTRARLMELIVIKLRDDAQQLQEPTPILLKDLNEFWSKPLVDLRAELESFIPKSEGSETPTLN